MIKLETHCHSLGGSYCAVCEPEYIAKKYKAHGYGGIVLTNHFSQYSYPLYKGDTDKEKIDFYFGLYDNFSEVCSKYGIKTFLGMEVLVDNPNGHSEYVIYNFDRKIVYDNKLLFKMSQEELYRLCEKNNVFMYKVHPFRDGELNGDAQFMHGAEYFNGHFHHYNHNDLAREFCKKNNLIKMSGTDYHDKEQPITAGLYVPESISTEEQLTEYIRSGKAHLIKNEELYIKELRKSKNAN